MTKAQKRNKIKRVVNALKILYPDAKCSLEYEGQGWKLLIMGRLSAQCTDERVNIVCRELFSRFPTLESIAEADLCEIEQIVKPCGLYKMKANNIKSSCIRLLREYAGQVPKTMEELLTFEGVGRKIANLLLSDLHGIPAIVADTHCMRICGRLGMYKEGMKDPYKTEKIMSELVEPREQCDFCHRLVFFGREYCKAQSPRCGECPIKHICKTFNPQIIRLERERYGEALDLVSSVASKFVYPTFEAGGESEYERIIDETRQRCNIDFFACTDNERVVGVLGMRENGHIGYFYVNPLYQGLGIGKMLFAEVKNACLSKYGKITVNASDYGRGIYEHLGFLPKGERQSLNGVVFTPMQYTETEN